MTFPLQHQRPAAYLLCNQWRALTRRASPGLFPAPDYLIFIYIINKLKYNVPSWHQSASHPHNGRSCARPYVYVPTCPASQPAAVPVVGRRLELSCSKLPEAAHSWTGGPVERVRALPIALTSGRWRISLAWCAICNNCPSITSRKSIKADGYCY